MLMTEFYSLEELRQYIRIKLCGTVWRLEGLSSSQSDTIDQGIGDALMAYSRRCPIMKFTTITCDSTRTAYKIPEKLKPCYTVFRVDFVYPSLVVSPFMSSLVGVAPVMNLEGRDFDSFLTWRKTFQRITGIEPKWLWDEPNQEIRIHQPIQNCIAGVFAYCPRNFEDIRLVHKDWIKRASLAHVKQQLGEIRRKFSGNIPGPGGKDLQLNGDKLVDEAKAELEKLQEELMGFQLKVVPIMD